jgi:uroporphyrinogen III methyltransferase / synthase
MTGKVWLVGAGPGDPGLITVKGRAALEQAEVVVYDRFVPDDFLEYVAEGAEVVYTSRRPGLHEMTEDEIDALLAQKAREGKRVVRLIGGDPFVFGRGGEEAATLHAAGVPFEIVSGVTSSVATPAYAGIPITYRDLAASFAVISGDEDPNLPDSPVRWAQLATATDTLVMVEATANLPAVTEALIRHGRAAETPVAVVSWGTHARQETVVGTLATIAEMVERAGLHSPAVTIVGEVARLRDRLRWYDDRPLFGKRVLLARSRLQASVLRRTLQEEGADVVELPALEVVETTAPEMIRRVVGALGDGQYSWVLLTSSAAVDLLFRHLIEQGRDARAFGNTRVCAIGPGTAEALMRHGIRADLNPEEAVGDTVLAQMAGRGVGRRRILVPKAEYARPDLVAALRKLGVEVEEVGLYVTSIPRQPNRESLGQLRRGEIDIVAFPTVSSVTNVVKMLGEDRGCLHDATIACLSPMIARTARELGLRVDVLSEDASIPGLVATLRDHFAVAGTA